MRTKTHNLALLLILIVTAALPQVALARELSTEDFTFDGPFGSAGATIERVAANHFKVILGHAPDHPTWCNMLQFQILRNAKGNRLQLDVYFYGGDDYRFNHYAHSSWSYDGINWQPIKWQKETKESSKGDTLLFPEFEEDIVYFGHQVPMSYENLVEMMEKWDEHPHAEVHTLGKSLKGRNIFRLEITNPQSPYARNRRWIHYFGNQHPGEHNAQWRMVGMIDWLLSDAGADCRNRSISHFVLMMYPDGPSHGWYRVGVQGVDGNRSYLVTGADKQKQAHEAYITQKDLEGLMVSEAPVTDLWSMHTWGGVVEPIMLVGPEMGTVLPDWTKLKNIVKQNDPDKLIKPLAIYEKSGNPSHWNNGPHVQFGITTVLCEGAGSIITKQDNVASGVVLMKSLAQYYRETKKATTTQQPPKPFPNTERADEIAQLGKKVSDLEERLHKERHEFSKMGVNNYRIFQYGTGEAIVLKGRLNLDEINAFGNNVCMNGDVNGDGFADILISACLWNNSTGKVFLFYGGKDIDVSSPDLVFEGEGDGDYFGGQSGVFAHINNDGYDDVIIGARGYHDFDGRVYIYHGGPNMDNTVDVMLDGEKGAEGWFGLMVNAGDVDNDGYVDILVGAQYHDQGRGRVYLYWGGKALDTHADMVFEGEGYFGAKPRKLASGDVTQGWFGRRIDVKGDVNGDGYRDILIGARHAGGVEDNGASYLYFGGSKQEMDGVCDCVFRGDAGNEMGSSLDLYDIDSDGLHDVVVGARFSKTRGVVSIWWGGTQFNDNRPADILLKGEYKSNMGGDDVVCGDFNNDGYGDILVGAYNYPGDRIWHGRAYVFFGNNRHSMDTECDYIFDPEESTGFFGMRVSTGDVNNDGYLDALIGSPANDKTFLYLGPFTTEDLQDRIKAQQAVVKQVEQQLSEAKQRLSSIKK